MPDSARVIEALMKVIADRKTQRPAGSYTVQLFDGGIDAIGAKVCEEAAEVVDAARSADERPAAVIHEAADLVYHLLVVLAHANVSWADVETELARRFGISGLDEKASRSVRNA